MFIKMTCNAIICQWVLKLKINGNKNSALSFLTSFNSYVCLGVCGAFNGMRYHFRLSIALKEASLQLSVAAGSLGFEKEVCDVKFKRQD